jgi:hypothetical protein
VPARAATSSFILAAAVAVALAPAPGLTENVLQPGKAPVSTLRCACDPPKASSILQPPQAVGQSQATHLVALTPCLCSQVQTQLGETIGTQEGEMGALRG